MISLAGIGGKGLRTGHMLQLLPGIDINREIDEDSSAFTIPPAAGEDEPPTENLSVHFSKLTLNPQKNVFFGKSR